MIISTCYDCRDAENVEYRGFTLGENDFTPYLSNRVKDRFFDTSGTAELITSVQEALEDTGFDSGTIVQVFQSSEVPDNWRIGECLAECLLEDHFNAIFHYNNSRDMKNPNGNYPGADLVGISTENNDICFLFGEVKTSSDIHTPPQVMYGRTGMIKQLENLRDIKQKRHDLVRWLWNKTCKVPGSDFYEKCKGALENYIQNDHNKVRLFGVLIRDTLPSKDDLRARAKSLNYDIPTSMEIKLFAFYTPLAMENENWVNALRGA